MRTSEARAARCRMCAPPRAAAERARASTAAPRRPRGCRRGAAPPGTHRLSPNRRRTNDAIDSSSSSPAARHDHLARHPQPAAHAEERRAASASEPQGKPRNEPSASGWSRPPRSTYAVRGGSVGTRRSPSPSSRQSATRRRLLHEQRVGPPSITQPSNRSVVMTPPAAGRLDDADAQTARCSSYAAAMPAMPPPTTDVTRRQASVVKGARRGQDPRVVDECTARASARARPASTAGCRGPG
jgi:hypothetical protein